MTCLRMAWMSRSGPLAMLVGALTGITLTAGLYLYVAATKPVVPTYLGYRIDGHWLVTSWRASSSAPCTRTGVYMLSRVADDGTSDFIPLASTLNGRNFTTGVQMFHVRFRIEHIAPGDWSFRYRLQHECPPFGMVHWESTIGPIDVKIP